ncbi:MAG: hypothetical protein LBK70_02390 [Clostridiales bacterium]|jgi:hypothetical protein|nr:hypothetical protein [Clostridiales bacterium]
MISDFESNDIDPLSVLKYSEDDGYGLGTTWLIMLSTKPMPKFKNLIAVCDLDDIQHMPKEPVDDADYVIYDYMEWIEYYNNRYNAAKYAVSQEQELEMLRYGPTVRHVPPKLTEQDKPDDMYLYYIHTKYNPTYGGGQTHGLDRDAAIDLMRYLKRNLSKHHGVFLIKIGDYLTIDWDKGKCKSLTFEKYSKSSIAPNRVDFDTYVRNAHREIVNLRYCNIEKDSDISDIDIDKFCNSVFIMGYGSYDIKDRRITIVVNRQQ